MWWTGDSCTLFVGMQIGAVTMKNSMKLSQKLKIEVQHGPAITVFSVYSKKPKTLTWKGTCIPTFIAAMFNKRQDLKIR